MSDKPEVKFYVDEGAKNGDRTGLTLRVGNKLFPYAGEEAEAILAAIETVRTESALAASPQGWRPISEAPNANGLLFEVVDALNRRSPIVVFYSDTHTSYRVYDRDDGDGSWIDLEDFTHWRPFSFPAAPEPTKEQG